MAGGKGSDQGDCVDVSVTHTIILFPSLKVIFITLTHYDVSFLGFFLNNNISGLQWCDLVFESVHPQQIVSLAITGVLSLIRVYCFRLWL